MFFFLNHYRKKMYRITYNLYGTIGTDTIYGRNPTEAMKKYNEQHCLRDIIDIVEIEIRKEYL